METWHWVSLGFFAVAAYFYYENNRTKQSMPDPAQPRPKDWTKTLSQLHQEMKEGKRKSMNGQEIAWAREYEMSLLPEDTRFPEDGDLYEATRDQPVRYLTHYSAPYTGGGDGKVPAGTRVKVRVYETVKKSLGYYADPVEYEKMESLLVPEEERRAKKYGGMYLSLSIYDLNSEKWRRVD